MAVTSAGAIGATLVVTGVVGAFGAITGRLTPMIAALWYPHIVTDTEGADVAGTGGQSWLAYIASAVKEGLRFGV